LSGETRTRGIELEAKGKILPKFNTNLSYSLIDARIVGQTSTASKNNIIPLAPKHKFTWENKYIYDSQLSLALALIRQSSQFAGADNSSKLNGFKRFDFSIFYKINKKYNLQLNVENIFNEKYFLTAHNNNNLMPGSTRYFRINFNVDL
jgi:catecholate siderophore receptor